MEDHNTWLGKDLKTWSQSVRSGYARAFILFALHNTGVFEALRRAGAQTVNELAESCNVEADLLEGVLNFLVFSDRVMEKSDGRFMLTEDGREWLFAAPVIAMSWGAVGAYSCLLSELAPALRREKQYGIDFERNEDYLATGSHATGQANYPWVVSQLSKLGIQCVADLGCGSANVLISFCSLDENLRGVGIDISPQVLEEARRQVDNAGMQDRIHLLQGDVTMVDTLTQFGEDVGAFNAIMVFHEFLQFGEDYVVSILKDMKERFPGLYIIIGEFSRVSDEEFASMPLPDRMHLLFYQYIIHPLKRQGQPTTHEHWLTIFDKAGLELVVANRDFPFRLTEYLLKF